MEDIIAVRVKFEDGNTRHYLTWGRIQDAVDASEVERLVRRFAEKRGPVAACRICDSLQEATNTRYFFEQFHKLCATPIPFGSGYESWRAERAAAMQQGRELYDCG